MAMMLVTPEEDRGGGRWGGLSGGYCSSSPLPHRTGPFDFASHLVFGPHVLVVSYKLFLVFLRGSECATANFSNWLVSFCISGFQAR